MGKRGPAPKPTQLRVLHGERPYRINSNEPQPAPGLPAPPAELDEAGRRIWDFVVTELDAMGLAQRPDIHQLHPYVEEVRLHTQVSVLVSKAGPLIKDRDNELRTNPAVRIQRGRTDHARVRKGVRAHSGRAGVTGDTEGRRGLRVTPAQLGRARARSEPPHERA